MRSLDIATIVALDKLGTLYKWGGNSPVSEWGVDCSGYVCFVLRPVGLIDKKDYSAQMLYDKFSQTVDVVDVASEGDLIFWKNDVGNVTHVEYALNDTTMVGSSGGNRLCVSEKVAKKMGAYVKVRPISARPGGIILNTSSLF